MKPGRPKQPGPAPPSHLRHLPLPRGPASLPASSSSLSPRAPGPPFVFSLLPFSSFSANPGRARVSALLPPPLPPSALTRPVASHAPASAAHSLLPLPHVDSPLPIKPSSTPQSRRLLPGHSPSNSSLWKLHRDVPELRRPLAEALAACTPLAPCATAARPQPPSVYFPPCKPIGKLPLYPLVLTPMSILPLPHAGADAPFHLRPGRRASPPAYVVAVLSHATPSTGFLTPLATHFTGPRQLPGHPSPATALPIPHRPLLCL